VGRAPAASKRPSDALPPNAPQPPCCTPYGGIAVQLLTIVRGPRLTGAWPRPPRCVAKSRILPLRVRRGRCTRPMAPAALGRDTVSGEWTDIAMLQTPDGNGHRELFEYIHPEAIEPDPPDRTRSACTASLSRSMTRPGSTGVVGVGACGYGMVRPGVGLRNPHLARCAG